MIINMFLLVCALCIDMFVASTAYGTNGICISWKQIAVVNVVSSLFLGFSLSFGNLLDSWIPETFTREICFISLIFLGCMKLADSSIRQYIRKHRKIQKKINFTFSQLHFIINIYSDPMEADADANHRLSWRELIFFALAMSIDNLIAGTLAAFMKISIPVTIGIAFIMGELFTYAGLFIGHKIGSKCPKDLSWVGGILFIILAFLKC